MKRLFATACALLLTAVGTAQASDADFPRYPIYNNPFKTPEQEQQFAHQAEQDWDTLTDAEQKYCAAIGSLPQAKWDRSALITPLVAPPLTYERLDMCVSAAVMHHAKNGD